MPNIQLHDYQEHAKKFITDQGEISQMGVHTGRALFFDMGTGKTLISLDALWDMDPKGHVLVVAPKKVAKSTWLDEISKWGYTIRTDSLIENMETRKALPKEKRLEKYAQIRTAQPTVYMINRDLIVDLVENMLEVSLDKKSRNPHFPLLKVGTPRRAWPFRYIILDELQAYKDQSSLRTRALKIIKPEVEWIVGLTGTPNPKSLIDLWSQIYILDGGARLGSSLNWYKNQFFFITKVIDNVPVAWEPKPGAEDEIFRRISDITLSEKNTSLNLPPVTFNDIYAHFTPAELKKYAKFKRTCVFDYGGLENIKAANAGVLQNKLSQFASGAMYIRPNEERNNTLKEDEDFVVIHQQKLDIAEHIVNNTNSPIAIAYFFKSDLTMLQKAFSRGVELDDNNETIRRWNNGDIDVLFIQCASAAGLNLQDGPGHNLVWYSLTPNLEHYMQTNTRLFRQGQKKPGFIHRIIMKNSVDERIAQILDLKEASQDRLLEAVRLELKN